MEGWYLIILTRYQRVKYLLDSAHCNKMASSADDPLVDALINNDLKFSSIYDRIFNKVHLLYCIKCISSYY